MYVTCLLNYSSLLKVIVFSINLLIIKTSSAGRGAVASHSDLWDKIMTDHQYLFNSSLSGSRTVFQLQLQDASCERREKEANSAGRSKLQSNTSKKQGRQHYGFLLKCFSSHSFQLLLLFLIVFRAASPSPWACLTLTHTHTHIFCLDSDCIEGRSCGPSEENVNMPSLLSPGMPGMDSGC